MWGSLTLTKQGQLTQSGNKDNWLAPGNQQYLGRFWFDVQFLDTLVTRDKSLSSCPTHGVLQSLKQSLLVLMTRRGAEGDGMELGCRPHVQLVVRGHGGSRFGSERRGTILVLLVLSCILEVTEHPFH